jgi:ribosomal protein S18 acetylase RimI-like enzyme
VRPTIRRYQGEEDFWRIRAFLREVFLLNGRRELSWHVARLDYWRWHFVENCGSCGPLEEVTFLWETGDGQIAAVLHPVFVGEAFLHVHPAYRSQALEDEMLACAEELLAASPGDDQCSLSIQVHRDDIQRQRTLALRGYSLYGHPVRHWRRDLDGPLPEAQAPPGYTIRAMGDAGEFPARSWASWRAFHPDEPDEDYEGWEWYRNVQAGPLYRRDLDIVAVTQGGEVAAFSTLWYDDVTRSAVCVLVGTVPEHQRRGLGRAVVLEGLRRLQRMGGTRALANGYDPPANALYDAVLGTAELSDCWLKRW